MYYYKNVFHTKTSHLIREINIYKITVINILNNKSIFQDKRKNCLAAMEIPSFSSTKMYFKKLLNKLYFYF